MITEDYISFETAKLLKEKGFDETCRAFWKKWNGEINFCDCNTSHTFEYCHNTMLENYNDSEETNIAAPTLQMTMKWLRKVHHIFIDITFRFSRNADNDINFSYYAEKYENYYGYGDYCGYGDGEFNSYEEACESAIKYCLENLI